MSCACMVAVLVAVYWLLPAAWAQGFGEDVHVTPRVDQTQTKNGQPADDPSLKTHTKPIKVDVNLVLVPVSIVDPENRQVTGLDKENFEVFEGKERQQIQHFSSEDAPVSLGAIFDVSGSMANKIERAREAVVEFFKTANPEDEFFMIAFADKPEEVTDFTQSVEDIEETSCIRSRKGARPCWMRFISASTRCGKPGMEGKHCSSSPMAGITTAGTRRARSRTW